MYLPFGAGLDSYRKQADELFGAYNSGDPDTIQLLHQKHPRFLDEIIPWLQKDISDDEIRSAGLVFADIQLALARYYDFKDWEALEQYAASVANPASPVHQFEAAVDAAVNGDAGALKALLTQNPDLVRARSTRVTHFDPPVHRCTLLHYVGANGVEGYRQKTPSNAVEITRMLLQAGAEVDALADLYGVPCTTMTLLVSSCHPHQAGLQIALAETLLEFGADIDGRGSMKWGSPLTVALVFGYPKTAEALAARGAHVDLVGAAGLGWVEHVRRLLDGSDSEDRHRALALAAEHGRSEIVRFLVNAGEDPSRYNPEGTHSHSTPLHQAIAANHLDTVRTLVDLGASLDLTDKIYQGTPLDWAIYLKKSEIGQYLRSRGAKTRRDLKS